MKNTKNKIIGITTSANGDPDIPIRNGGIKMGV
jgi:hypothetical protein